MAPAWTLKPATFAEQPAANPCSAIGAMVCKVKTFVLAVCLQQCDWLLNTREFATSVRLLAHPRPGSHCHHPLLISPRAQENPPHSG
jgi:hypothetical protein